MNLKYTLKVDIYHFSKESFWNKCLGVFVPGVKATTSMNKWTSSTTGQMEA